mmetsp:Transcript_9480/g.25756  ORF Transcript_9480/g.25756 Transcript_9480/m.25756 type:complete len:221 (+) Transcript_9480:8-670(+)
MTDDRCTMFSKYRMDDTSARTYLRHIVNLCHTILLWYVRDVTALLVRAIRSYVWWAQSWSCTPPWMCTAMHVHRGQHRHRQGTIEEAARHGACPMCQSGTGRWDSRSNNTTYSTILFAQRNEKLNLVSRSKLLRMAIAEDLRFQRRCHRRTDAMRCHNVENVPSQWLRCMLLQRYSSANWGACHLSRSTGGGTRCQFSKERSKRNATADCTWRCQISQTL